VSQLLQMDGYSEEEYDRCEQRRRDSDLIYRVCLNPDTTEINGIISKFKETVVLRTTGTKVTPSKGVLRMINLAIDGNDRHMKQALFFWYIYSDREFAQSLIDPENPQVPPNAFKRFYDDPKHLQKLCNDLLVTKINCLREFVKQVRNCYFAQR